MPEDYEQLQRKIEEGLAAARELKRMKAEQQRKDRPKLRLIKGGMVGGAIWVGVEWLRGYGRTVAVLAVSGLVGGVVIAEQPHSPGSDPPEAIKPPASVRPSVTPEARTTVKPTPRPPRTSPLRTLGRSSTPVAAPTTTTNPRKPQPTRTKTPRKKPSPSPSLTETPTIVKTSALVTPATSCVVDLLGVELCLPLG